MAVATINLWGCHKAECQECFEEFLVLGDPQRGDRITCPRCSAKFKVADICSDYRSDKKPTELETQAL